MFIRTQHPLLSEPQVGKARPTNRELPYDDHVYGYKPPPQPEGAKQVIHAPEERQRNKQQKTDKDFTKINTLIQGQKGKSLIPDIRKKQKKGTLEIDIKLPDDTFAYGVKTKTSTPIKKLISKFKSKPIWKQKRKNYGQKISQTSQRSKLNRIRRQKDQNTKTQQRISSNTAKIGKITKPNFSLNKKHLSNSKSSQQILTANQQTGKKTNNQDQHNLSNKK